MNGSYCTAKDAKVYIEFGEGRWGWWREDEERPRINRSLPCSLSSSFSLSFILLAKPLFALHPWSSSTSPPSLSSSTLTTHLPPLHRIASACTRRYAGPDSFARHRLSFPLFPSFPLFFSFQLQHLMRTDAHTYTCVSTFSFIGTSTLTRGMLISIEIHMHKYIYIYMYKCI